MKKRDRIMRFVSKVVAGGPGRQSRFHTEAGRRISLADVHDIFPQLLRKIRTKITGQRPFEPWWPMPVVRLMDDRLKKSDRVLEFGCGTSTLWLAERVSTVVSVEDDPEWQKKICEEIASRAVKNVSIRLASDAHYYNLEWAQGIKFDVIIVDGSYRWKCIEASLPLLAEGGMLYLDNSDGDKDLTFYENENMHKEAQRALMRYAATSRDASITSHVGIISGEFHAGEGLLLQRLGLTGDVVATERIPAV